MLRILILSLGAAAGALLIAVSLKPIADAREARNWPTTEATITVSTIEEVITTRKKSGDTNRTERMVKYRPAVAYEYFIQGEKHEGSKMTYSHIAYPSPEQAKSQIAEYAPGDTVQIRYNPAKPQDSVIKPEGHASFVITYFGAFFLSASLWFMIRPYLKRKVA